jgi:hypothetical protein
VMRDIRKRPWEYTYWFRIAFPRVLSALGIQWR